MKENISFNFKFKGNRTYVHGTDMYNNICEYLKDNNYLNIDSIVMSIHKISRTNLDGVFTDEQTELSNNKYALLFSFNFNNKSYKILLKENNQSIDHRYEYPEENIINLSNIISDSKKIILIKEINYSPIEKIVAMNKALHENLFPNVKGKWYFTKIQLEDNIYNIKPKMIEIELLKNMNYKLTKSLIKIDDTGYGYLYFSLV